MTELVSDQATRWAGILIVVVPLLIVGTAELQERLRQRDSAYAAIVAVLRTWTIPLGAVWLLLFGLFEFGRDSLLIRILGTGVVLSLAVVVLMVIRIVVRRIADRARAKDRGRVPQLLLAMPRVGVIILTGWVLLDTVWGVDLSAALTALGVTSLVVSFALQDTLSGLASGLLLLADSPFQPGDWIRAGDVEGKVVDINWRSSRIVDRNGDLLVVPNAELAGGTVVNFDAPERLHRVVVPVQVAYVNPPTLAKEMLLEAARSTEGVLDHPPPVVRVVQTDDPLMGYEVQVWIDDYTIAPRVASDLGGLVWYSSHRNDVPLPSPAYDLYVYDGVEAGLAGVPDRAELRRRLQVSPLLESLSIDDLERLAAAASPVRFAQGEKLFRDPGEAADLYVLWEGSARVAVEGVEGRDIYVTEAGPGDVVGLLRRSESMVRPPYVLFVTDCETVRIKQDVFAAVASRNPELSTALNQITATRQRRLERVLERLDAMRPRLAGNGAGSSGNGSESGGASVSSARKEGR